MTTPTAPTTQQVTIGPNHKVPHSRIWLEGKRLAEAGFTVGTRYSRTVIGGTIRLVIDPVEGRYKVSGKGEKPIVDITGSTVRKTFPVPDPAARAFVSVTYLPALIIIERA